MRMPTVLVWWSVTAAPTTAPPEPCIDKVSQCLVWAAHGECEKNKQFMLSSCPVACGACDLITNTTTTTAAHALDASTARAVSPYQVVRNPDPVSPSLSAPDVALKPPALVAAVGAAPTTNTTSATHATNIRTAASEDAIRRGARLPGNASAILQQARAGLTTALREVRSCRTAKQQCREDLEACRAGSAAEQGAHRSEDQLLQSESQRCLNQLQQSREALQLRTKEVADEKSRSEAIAGAAQKQLGVAKTRLKQSMLAEEACNRQLEGAATAETNQQQVQAQLSTLRRKLEQKEQLEDAIEGKHSKLTEVYRALEAECQAELTKLRARVAPPPASDGGANSDVGSRGHSSTSPPGMSPCGDNSTPCVHARNGTGLFGVASSALGCDLRIILLATTAGGLVGWLLRGRVCSTLPRRPATLTGLSNGRTGGLVIEEMRGWMPSTDDMKLS